MGTSAGAERVFRFRASCVFLCVCALEKHTYSPNTHTHTSNIFPKSIMCLFECVSRRLNVDIAKHKSVKTWGMQRTRVFCVSPTNSLANFISRHRSSKSRTRALAVYLLTRIRRPPQNNAQTPINQNTIFTHSDSPHEHVQLMGQRICK